MNGLIVIMLSVSVLALQVFTQYPSTNQSIGLMRLAQAKVALIAYATNYQDLYSERSAGPGHFPCPDTDVETISNVSDSSRAGPNPPCGRSALAAGLLPRRIQFDDERIFFQPDFDTRYWYAVSSDFINNPVNRVVNFETLENMKLIEPIATLVALPEHTDSAAAIELLEQMHNRNLPNSDGLGQTQLRSALHIFAKDIQRSVSTRVAGWLLLQLQQAVIDRCLQQPTPCSSYPQMQFGHPLTKPYEYRELQLLSWLAPIELNNQHWFIRNQWLDSFVLKASEKCLSVESVACDFRYSGIEDSEIIIELNMKELE